MDGSPGVHHLQTVPLPPVPLNAWEAARLGEKPLLADEQKIKNTPGRQGKNSRGRLLKKNHLWVVGAKGQEREQGTGTG